MSAPWVGVSPNDIVRRWRPLTTAESSIVRAVIADAQDILEEDADVAGLPKVIDDDSRRARAYKRIVANMVIRVLKNPDGILSETIDDYTYRRDEVISAGVLYVADDELARLRPEDRRPRSGAFSISPG